MYGEVNRNRLFIISNDPTKQPAKTNPKFQIKIILTGNIIELRVNYLFYGLFRESKSFQEKLRIGRRTNNSPKCIVFVDIFQEISHQPKKNRDDSNSYQHWPVEHMCTIVHRRKREACMAWSNIRQQYRSMRIGHLHYYLL